MAWFWWLLGVVVVVLWVVAVVDIVRSRRVRSGATTSAWILIVLILPVIGTVLYFLVNGSYGSGALGTRDPDATKYGR